MKNLKSILVILLLLVSTFTDAQITKFRTTSVSYKVEDDTQSSWANLEEVSILGAIDTEKSRITIYSKETQTYDIIEILDKRIDSDGDEFWPFICIDGDNLKCQVVIARLNSQDGARQVYINFRDFRFVYNIVLLD